DDRVGQGHCLWYSIGSTGSERDLFLAYLKQHREQRTQVSKIPLKILSRMRDEEKSGIYRM
ncbi:MAG: hypothetical protein KDD55_04325, partial [Bdellovibrionales bacterium]|nr:hypothetical protein [Bdellovibrionales bacterium]